MACHEVCWAVENTNHLQAMPRRLGERLDIQAVGSSQEASSSIRKSRVTMVFTAWYRLLSQTVLARCTVYSSPTS